MFNYNIKENYNIEEFLFLLYKNEKHYDYLEPNKK